MLYFSNFSYRNASSVKTQYTIEWYDSMWAIEILGPILITNKESHSCTNVQNKSPEIFFVRKQNVNKPNFCLALQSVKRVEADFVTI